MKTKIAFELCLLALAVVVSIMAMTMALRGGWEISRPNFYYALCWGLLGYVGCKLATLVPVAPRVHSTKKFLGILSVYSILLYLYFAMAASA